MQQDGAQSTIHSAGGVAHLAGVVRLVEGRLHLVGQQELLGLGRSSSAT